MPNFVLINITCLVGFVHSLKIIWLGGKLSAQSIVLEIHGQEKVKPVESCTLHHLYPNWVLWLLPSFITLDPKKELCGWYTGFIIHVPRAARIFTVCQRENWIKCLPSHELLEFLNVQSFGKLGVLVYLKKTEFLISFILTSHQIIPSHPC